MAAWGAAGARAVLRRLGSAAAASRANYCSRSTTIRYAGRAFGPIGADNLPVHVDWTVAGAVTPVQDQRSPGTCWAFATTGAVEGINYIRTGKLVKLSEQQLLDCNSSSNAYGVHLGSMPNAFAYIIKYGGIVPADVYPYMAKQGICQPITSDGVTIDGFNMVTPDCEQALKEAVARQPVAVAVRVDKRFNLFINDIISGQNYPVEKLNHALLCVGYGEMLDGRLFWLLKNSWGYWYGFAGGYVYVARNTGLIGGAFGIARSCFYPTKHCANQPVRVNTEKNLVT